MREQIDNDMLESINGGAIDYVWDKNTQKGSVSSTVTGQTFTFGADKAKAVYQYVMGHRQESDTTQMDAIQAIING